MQIRHVYLTLCINTDSTLNVGHVHFEMRTLPDLAPKCEVIPTQFHITEPKQNYFYDKQIKYYICTPSSQIRKT